MADLNQWIILLMRNSFRLQTLSSPTQYLAQPPLEIEKRIDAIQVEKKAKPNGDVIMREISVKRNYTRYSDQNKSEVHQTVV